MVGTNFGPTLSVALLFAGLGLNVARAASPIAAICEQAAQVAATRSGVPVQVLLAISLTETGRKRSGAFEPWPWTVNMEGKGVWFDTREEAQAYVDKNFARGARSFDVGCFQLNYKWHGQAFESLEAMFDPDKNAAYAAKFLRELFEEKGNWADAAGAYHSRTPKFANKYIKRFNTLLARMHAEPSVTAVVAGVRTIEPSVTLVRLNGFPLLLRGSAPASLGSLMPGTAGMNSRRLIGGG